MLTGDVPVGGKRKKSGRREKLSCSANPDDSLSQPTGERWGCNVSGATVAQSG